MANNILNIAVILLISGFVVESSDYRCSRISGSCKDDRTGCSGGMFVSYLCDGGSHRRCCIHGHDTGCNNVGGTCQYDGKFCFWYSTGLCAGGSRRRCCRL